MAESSIAGMAPTGRRLVGPGVEIRELSAPSGLKHLAYVHDEALRSHPALGPEIQGRLAFMEQPEVGGMVRLAWHDASSGTFVYPTGTVWTVAEVVRIFADSGDAPGVKAGLELAYLVGETLVEAAESGVGQGIPCHGNVSPWTVGFKGDGQPVVMLYGVPHVEILAWRENPKRAVSEDSFRYAPPERLEGDRPEDVTSDLLSLALVSLEMMVGRPVYDGVVADVRQQATRGEGVRRLYQWREKLPQNVREVMGRALKPDPDTRFPNGMDFVYAVHDLLGSIDVEGPSLVEVMAKVRATERRVRSVGTRTGALTQEELKELAADLDEIDDRPLPPPRRARSEEPAVEEPAEKPRWSRATRNADRKPDPGGTTGLRERPSPPGRQERPTPPPEPAGAVSATHDRPRRRLRGDGVVTGTEVRPTLPQLEEDTAARDRLRRRLREPRTGDPPVPAQASPVTIDLDAPDDVVLEPITGRTAAQDTAELAYAPPSVPIAATAPPPEPERPAAPEPTLSRRMRRERPDLPSPPPPATSPPPPPPPPVSAPPPAEDEPLLEDSTAERSAAAALLERLRTSGGRRRRRPPTGGPEGSAQGAPVDAPPAAVAAVVAPPVSVASPVSVAPPVSVASPVSVAPPVAGPPVSAVPVVAPAAAPPPIGPPILVTSPSEDPPTALVSTPPPTTVPPRRREVSEPAPEPSAGGECLVTDGDDLVGVPSGTAGQVALRAALELGLLPIDATGRWSGVARLVRDGRPLPATEALPPGGPYLLEVEPSSTRIVEVVVDGTPGSRVRTPVALGAPCGALARALAALLELEGPGWSLRIGGVAVDPHAPLIEVLGEGRSISLTR